MSTDLFRFQIKLLGEGYVQVPKTELRTNTFAIEGTDVLVNDGKVVTRNMFVEDGSYFDKYVEEVKEVKIPKAKSKVVLDVSPDLLSARRLPEAILTTQIDNSAEVEISNDSAS